MPGELQELIDAIRPPQPTIATTLVQPDGTSNQIDVGADTCSPTTLFEVGSITKSITGTLLAVLANQGIVSLETTVGEVLGISSAVAAVTLVQLATHTSGLPRLSPNHEAVADDPANPYRHFDVDALYGGLAATELTPSAEPVYSNFGYQLLGHVLERAAKRPLAELLVLEVLRPAGCLNPVCGAFPTGGERIPGYVGRTQVPRWQQPLPGAGAVELGIEDLGHWLRANTFPDSTALEEAVAIAQLTHWGDRRDGRGLGWRHYNGGLIQNGGTGGFRAFCGFVPSRAGVGVLTNLGSWEAIDGAAIGFLTRVIQAQS